MKKLVHILSVGAALAVSMSVEAQWSLSGNDVTATQYLGTVAGDTDPLVIKTNNVERMRITSAGNIGVGTTAPQTLFSLGTLVNNKKLALYDNPNSWYGFGIADGQMRLQIGNPTARFSFFVGDAKEVMTIKGDGNIGIGTTSPTNSLTVNGSIASKVIWLNPMDNLYEGGEIRFMGAGTYRYFYIDNYQGDLRILTKDANSESVKFFISNAGNVGIGTSAPGTYKLAVEGKLGARQIVVTKNAWADFVFHDKYRLKPLHEVEKFIKENKHLPDVPSEKDVLKDGVNLGDMDAVLLQKIEEMTLYIIDLKKQVDSQAQELLKLKNEKSAEFSSSMNK